MLIDINLYQLAKYNKAHRLDGIPACGLCFAIFVQFLLRFSGRPDLRHRKGLVLCGWHPPGSSDPAPHCGRQCPPQIRISGWRTAYRKEQHISTAAPANMRKIFNRLRFPRWLVLCLRYEYLLLKNITVAIDNRSPANI